MQINAEYLKNIIDRDLMGLLEQKRAYECRPDVLDYLALEEGIKSLKGRISDDMLNLYRTYGVQSIKGDAATVYVKDEYEIIRDRLTPSQIVAMFDYNPDAFKVSDKALRDTIEIARLAHASGDVSEGVSALLDMDLDRLRGPVKHSAIVRMAKI